MKLFKWVIGFLSFLLLSSIVFLCVKIWIRLGDKSTALELVTSIAGLTFFLGLAFRALLGFATRSFNWKNPFHFIDTLEHELTHALFGYLTFSPPSKLLATEREGGEVHMDRTNPLVALAPYFFPLWASISLGIGRLVRTELGKSLELISFFLLGVFLYRLGTEIGWNQPDFKIYGRLNSLLIIAVGLILIFSLFFWTAQILSPAWIREIPGEGLSFIQSFF